MFLQLLDGVTPVTCLLNTCVYFGASDPRDPAAILHSLRRWSERPASKICAVPALSPPCDSSKTFIMGHGPKDQYKLHSFFYFFSSNLSIFEHSDPVLYYCNFRQSEGVGMGRFSAFSCGAQDSLWVEGRVNEPLYWV